MIDSENRFTIDLYHGTSTLFLDSIVEHGLGGINPVKAWDLIELSKQIYELSEKHLKDSELWKRSHSSLYSMTQQLNGGSFNFQHGDTYLSPSQITATNYAIRKRYGSELLTYTLDFLKELTLLNLPEVNGGLFKKYSSVFGLIESAPSPLLIRVSNVPVNSLLSEHGDNPDINLSIVKNANVEQPEMSDLLLQQTNFRLTRAINLANLKFFLINVQEWNPYTPKYNLYEIKPSPITE